MKSLEFIFVLLFTLFLISWTSESLFATPVSSGFLTETAPVIDILALTFGVISSSVSARIDEYSPSSPVEINTGKKVAIKFKFTNTGDTSWTFYAAASLRTPNRAVVDLPVKPVTLAPDQQGSISWDYLIDTEGSWDIVFGIWKESERKTSLGHTRWLNGYIKGVKQIPSENMAEIIRNESVGTPVMVNVSGQQYMIVTLRRYIDPESTERSEVSYTPTVYVDAQWSPVFDRETIKKIGLIERARQLQKTMTDVVDAHRKALKNRLEIHGLNKLADFTGKFSENSLALAIRSYISGEATELSKKEWTEQLKDITSELISSGQDVVKSFISDPLIPLELSIYGDFVEAQDCFDYVRKTENIDGDELAYDYMDRFSRGWELGGARSAAWHLLDEIDKIGEPAYKEIIEQIEEISSDTVTKILNLDELEDILSIIKDVDPVVKYREKKIMAYNRYRSRLTRWFDPDRLSAAGQYTQVLAKRLAARLLFPDISVSQVVFNPDSIEAGENISVAFIIENSGDIPTGPFTSQIFLADSDGNSVLLGEHEVKESIDKDFPYSNSVILHVPGDITPRDYYIKVHADAFRDIDEIDEVNNTKNSLQMITITRSPRADLTVTSVSTSSSVQKGTTIPVSFTVENTGEANSEAFTVSVFLAITPYEITIPLRQFKINSLKSGDSNSVTEDVTIPSNLSFGDYYVTVYADAFRDIAESREDNNINKAPEQIDILSGATSSTLLIKLIITALIFMSCVVLFFTYLNKGFLRREKYKDKGFEENPKAGKPAGKSRWLLRQKAGIRLIRYRNPLTAEDGNNLQKGKLIMKEQYQDIQELFETACKLYYSQYNPEKALEKYKEIISRFPDSPEARYAETHIENIQNMSETEKKIYEQKRRKEYEEEQEETTLLTTSHYIEGKRIVEYKGIISVEAVMSVNIFRNIFSEVQDVTDDKTADYQKRLKKAEKLTLNELRDKAYELGANAVIGVDLDYNQLSSQGKYSVMVIANGTAVVVEDEQKGIKESNNLLKELLSESSDSNKTEDKAHD